MSQRLRLLDDIAAEVEDLVGDRVAFVGIDGVDGAGKTSFADELAARVRRAPVIRASIDDFHNPREVRYARGEDSPEGFYRDSFDYDRLKELLLDPLSRGGSMSYRTAAFDHRSDREVDTPFFEASIPSILIFDAIFLHRPEIVGYWDYSVFLDVSRRESLRRCVEREGAHGVTADPGAPVHRRYVRGQDLYLRACDPVASATRVIDNEDLQHPYIR